MSQIESNIATSATTGRFTAPVRVSSSQVQITLENLLQRPVAIAIVAGVFPTLSETFVYREAIGLKNRGWDVIPVGLHAAPTPRAAELADIARSTLVVYGQSFAKTLKAFALELVEEPLRTLKTLATAVADAIAPGEPVQPKDRLKLLGQAVAGIGLAGRLRNKAIRHLHCHFAHAPTTLGMYAAIQLGATFSFTGHANDLFQRRILLKRKLERASFVACISRWHRELYRNIAPADDLVYSIVRCGVDFKTWATHEHLQSQLLQLVSVGRLVPKKGFDTLLSAAAKLPAGINWRLTIAGDGPDRSMLEQLSIDLGIRDRINFLGAVENSQIAKLLETADVFVLACRTDSQGDRDGIPVALMEAMASSVPVIAGDLPAIRELITHEKSGLLVDGDNPNTITAAINRLAADPVLAQQIGSAGRAAANSEFELDQNLSRLEKLLRMSIRHFPGIETAPSVPTTRRYALITPCRDEAQYARRSLDSVVRQSVPPSIWVIVDDGSTDQTPAILAEYAAKYPWIRIVTRGNRGDRKLGGGVIDAFNTGYATIDPSQFDYVCKFDLDLDLPQRYFEKLMERMEMNPRIGTASGKPFFLHEGKSINEVCGDENSVGMIKFYRSRCFEEIGRFVPELMWDGIDCHRCRMQGWIAVSWRDPDLRFEHLRPMGTSHKNWWTGRVRHGVGQYYMGTGWVYLVASALFRMRQPPVVVGGLAMIWGYFRSMYQRKPRYYPSGFRTFLRRYQWQCLIRGKQSATEHLNRVGSMAWKA